MNTKVTVGPRFQVVIPKEVRVQLDVRPGEKLFVAVEGDLIVLRRVPSRPAHHLRGLHKEIWQNVDPLEYQRLERSAWPE